MKGRRVVIGLLVLTALVSAGYYLFGAPQTPPQQDPYLVQVEVRDLAVEIRTIGTLEAQQAHMISSQIKGPGAKIIYLAGNGRFVAKDEILVRFDAQPFETAVEELRIEAHNLTAALEAAEQLVEWEKNEAGQRIITAEYQHKVAQLDLRRLVEGEGPLKLAQLSDELDEAALALQRHRAYLEDLQELAKEGIANPAELDRVGEDVKILEETHRSAKRQFDSYQDYVLPLLIETARAKEQNTRLSIEQIRQASVHKIANAEATLMQARGRLRAAEEALARALEELDKTVLRAPFDGMIVHYETYRDGEMRTPREGDTVIVNQPIMYFPDISSLTVKSRVRESDLHRIRAGQQATVFIDAYPEERFAGRLAAIGALARKGGQGEEKFFQVDISLAETDDRLRPGMSARVVIHVASLSRVPTLPIQAVFRDAGGDYCYLSTGAFYERRSVTVGRRNEDFVEIVAGLDVGDRVSQVVPDTPVPRSGKRRQEAP
ncbi:efflux RND transporter periplasmic adaptor subunit [Desulfofustis glycolicus]|uniref:HlyD family secretion protein n=1 Tax=Desulfofustis glycolicus DSM 9705 TaxID=1121409 RepID=A0A1M5VZU5_9BACT|nr:efflux RND transporter periplasmic adaptor subunit [Desulfofustis glycolicus]MCB2215148.1 efflux RND transporter periplasmic adaptor subunit [Desulfobulbaceae bacterium]SHH80776.1 HlyD family secretion protein [Desulfofustis glycolicus DSM 9705]